MIPLRRVITSYFGAKVAFRYFPALSAIPAIRSQQFPHLLGKGRIDKLALTFDDGPDPVSTPLILDELDRLGIKATFFLLGAMAEAFPYTAKEVVARGHEIALHGQWHRNHLLRSARTISYDMERALETVSAATGIRPVYFRPPYGVLTRPTLLTSHRLSLTPVLWGAWGRDWRSGATPTSVLNDLRKDIYPGATLLLHDSDCTSAPGSFRATLGALEGLSNLAASSGLTLGPLHQHGF